MTNVDNLCISGLKCVLDREQNKKKGKPND